MQVEHMDLYITLLNVCCAQTHIPQPRHDVNQLLSSLLEGRPDETLRGDAWLQKAPREVEVGR